MEAGRAGHPLAMCRRFPRETGTHAFKRERKMDAETDTELIARHKHVAELIATGKRHLERMRPGGRRDDKSRFIGSLNFTLLQINSKIEERGLPRIEPSR